MQRKKLGTSLPTLSPEAAAFLKAGEPMPSNTVVPSEERRPALTLAPPSPAVAEPTTEEQAPEGAPRPERERKEKRALLKEVIEMPDVLVADSFKLPQALHRRLLRASSERKLEHVKPYTKQDIVAAALEEWLSKHGYGAGK